MKRLLLIMLVSFLCLSGALAAGNYKYETVAGDPTQTRIYTLDNGLKVFLTVNKEAPRIQTAIAVRVGAKNDPAETTGLAHYFEHLMFKGTKQFGTQNYAAEKPLLDAIEAQFEIYRKTTDTTARKAIYKRIDSLSYEASKYSIANEYDKLMATIGASGSNAFTSYDITCYIEEIPSNQVANWAKIQADRFKNAIIRGFHTELETVYEEKNMSLTKDPRKVYEALNTALFPNHPYGTQTVLGTQEHLKNPSIINIKNYYNTYYVPNNMAVICAGDFDPDQMIEIVAQNFGDMKPNANLPKLNFKPEPPLTAPVVKDVYGLESESVTLGWRFPGAASKDALTLELLGNILYNGQAGLIDLNINQQQKLLQAYAYSNAQTDYSIFEMEGKPKQGQTLDQVRDLLLEQVAKLKKGDFDETLLQATIANYKKYQIQQTESNFGRTALLFSAFSDGKPWAEQVNMIDRMSKITKQELVDFANKYLTEGYALINKHQGKDPNELKMDKPAITPILTNRDKTSDFIVAIQNAKVAPIEPVFLDFTKDMQVSKVGKQNIPLLYKKNVDNGLFELEYVLDMGTQNDKTIGAAVQYSDFLGTSKKSPEQIKKAFYDLACYYSVSVSADRVYIGVSGLDENMDKAIELVEELLADAQPNAEALESMKEDILTNRANDKLNQGTNFSRLQNYALYGSNSPAKNILSAEELAALTPEQLVAKFKALPSFEHKIMYYGPRAEKDLNNLLVAKHRVPAKLTVVDKTPKFQIQNTAANRILIAPYDAKQIYYAAVSSRGEKFEPEVYPILSLYNEYFGGGMNSVVFQEMREARGLAYSAWARIAEPRKLTDPYYYVSFIATQNDKTIDAMNAFAEIINNMPQSEKALRVAKENIESNLRTQRTTKNDVLWAYLDNERLGLTADRGQQLFAALPGLKLEDVVAFQQKWVKDRKYSYCILGKVEDMDLEKLKNFGEVVILTPEEIFGY